VTANQLLKRLLGEAAETSAATELDTPPELEPSPEAEAAPDMAQQPSTDAPTTQELVQQWRQGDHMAVAARLMFTEASYADFVDLVFAIGQAEGRELGQLLDELADTEGINPPETPPEYQQALQSAGSGEEEGVL
jgi:hypothetical protein